MNILIVARGIPTKKAPLNGIFEFDQARALAKAGHNVIFFGIDLRSIRRWRRFGICQGEKEQVKWYTINIPIGAVPMELICLIGSWAFRYLYRYVFRRRLKPDIIHAHFTEQACMTLKLVQRTQIPLVITEHSSDMSEKDVNRSLKNCAKRGYSRANCVISVSNALKQSIYRYTGVICKVIPNIAALDDFFFQPVCHKGFGFIMTGELAERKRPQLLLEAFTYVHEKYKDTFLGVIGDGNLKNQLEVFVNSKNLDESVIFYGQLPRNEIANLYRQYDCFVLPSRLETFGVVYIEAMSAGLPVIATKCGGPEDFITETAGILVSVDNLEELKESMIFMYEHYLQYDRRAISEYVSKAFSPQHIANDLTHIYERILKND